MAVLLLAVLALQSESPKWFTDYKEALSNAESQKRPLLVFARRKTCPNCKVMETRVLPAEDIRSVLSRKFICVVMDADNPPAEAVKLLDQIKGDTLPLIGYATPGGTFISGTSGYRQGEDFKSDLEGVLRNPLLKETPKDSPKDPPQTSPPPPPEEPKPIPENEIDQRFVSARIQLAQDHLTHKRKEKAIDVLEDVLQSYPKSPQLPEVKKLLDEARKLPDSPKK